VKNRFQVFAFKRNVYRYGEGEGDAAPDLPPRSGFAGAMSNAAAVEITRALPGVCRALGGGCTSSIQLTHTA
jgi:hypothetical protein